MNTNNEQSKAVTTSTLTEFANLEQLQLFGEQIVKSGLTPFKKGEQAVAAILFGKELGLGAMISVNNIHSINGRASVGIHIINALLQSAGVVVEVLRNYEPCVATVLKGEDGNPVMFDVSGVEAKSNDKKEYPQGCRPQFLREIFIDELPADYEIKGKRISNFKTVVKLTRKLKQPDGSWKDVVIIQSFSKTDADIADLSGKDNWRNHPKVMALNRAIAFGGRLIASDILLGVYETSEIADTYNVPYKVDDNGKVTIINKDLNTNVDSTTFEEVKEVTSLNENKNL